MDNREIDALVAEKVMGWERWTCSDFDYSKSLLLRSPVRLGSTWRQCGIEVPLDESAPYLVPHYSTDIAEAWLVVEKINSIPMDGSEGYQIRAKFEYYIGPRLIVANANEAAHHICFAALKAVGVDL